jgi:hypothetical protein
MSTQLEQRNDPYQDTHSSRHPTDQSNQEHTFSANGKNAGGSTFYKIALPLLEEVALRYGQKDNEENDNDQTVHEGFSVDELEQIANAAEKVGKKAFMPECERLKRHMTALEQLNVDIYDPITSEFPNLEVSLLMDEHEKIQLEFDELNESFENRFASTYSIKTRLPQYADVYCQLYSLVRDIQNICERWVERKRENPICIRSIFLSRLARVQMHMLHYVCDLLDFLVHQENGYTTDYSSSWTTADNVVSEHVKHNIATLSMSSDSRQTQNIAYLHRPEVKREERAPGVPPKELAKKLDGLHKQLFSQNPSFSPKPSF